MANVYVYSGAAGAGTGADWANAYTTLTAAAAGGAAGDDFWVASDHAESTAGTVTITFPGTRASPNRIISVSRAGSTPPVAADILAGASVSVNGNFLFTIKGTFYAYGITINGGSGASANGYVRLANDNIAFQRFDACALNVTSTAGSPSIQVGGGENVLVVWNNTTVSFGEASQGIEIFPGSKLVWRNTSSAVGGTIPTFLFVASQVAGAIHIDGVDLSAVNTTLFRPIGSTQYSLRLVNCRLHGSVTITAAPTSNSRVDVIRANSGAVNYTTEHHEYSGAQTIETTVVRTGGASDGTTTIAWKLVTTANAKPLMPFVSDPITIWGDSTASTTVTVYGIWGGGAVPNNNDIWIEAEYLGSGSYPLSSFASSGLATALTAASALSSDSSAWGGSTTKFKTSVTFTPGMKGPIAIRVFAGAASSTFYIDPKPEISGVTVSKSKVLAPGVYDNELGSNAKASGNLMGGLQ